MIRTRFAPSPTGRLHIGGARTALFCWAWAKKNGGEFILRFEDTDAARNDARSRDDIEAALRWLNLPPDQVFLQSQNAAAHREAAESLLKKGAAYYCYAAPAELEQMRAQQKARGETPRYDRRWRDSQKTPPPNVPPVVRFKTPLAGESVFDDQVRGRLRAAFAEMDDFVLLRADGAPTYNLAAAVDDIHMKISDVIRGDDHIMNTHRQALIWDALGAPRPRFAHLPMIMRKDGEGVARLSKRERAADVGALRRDGFLPAAVVNYMARLSWSHGDAEFFNADFLTAHFDFNAVQKSPAVFDEDKLRWLNRTHMKTLSDDALRAAVLEITDLTNDAARAAWPDESRLNAALRLLRPRADTLADFNQSLAYFAPGFAGGMPSLSPRQQEAMAKLADALEAELQNADGAAMKAAVKKQCAAAALKFAELGMPLREALTGGGQSPDIGEVMAVVGAEECARRIRAAVADNEAAAGDGDG